MAIALVNSTGTFAAGSATTLAASALNVTSGNLVVVVTRSGLTGFDVSSVTDTAGNTYTLIVQVLHTGANGTHYAMWYSANVTGNAANVVTANYSSSSSNRSVLVAQYSGVATTAALDSYAYGFDGTPASAPVLPYASFNANALLLGAFQIDAASTTWTPGSGFTTVVQDTSQVSYLEHKIGSLGGVVPAATNSSASFLTTQIAAVFLPPAAGGGGGGGSYGFA